MISPESLRPPGVYRLVCRPALPKDTPDVLELTRQIWEGQDYVPSVWADWLRDPDGLLAAAEYGGRVVGISKLTRLSPSEWWLEGLRVHPEYEGRGIASHLHNYLVNYWQRQGGNAIRLATASFRVPVQRISLRGGFSKVAELTQYVSKAISGSGEGFTPVASGEEAGVLAFTVKHPSPTCPNRLMGIGWQWVALSADWITPAIARDQAWWWRGEKGEQEALLLARVDDDEEKADRLMIQLLACQPEKLALCLKDCRRLAGSLGFKRVSWMAPLDPALEPALLEAGFERDWDESLFIYEKRLK